MKNSLCVAALLLLTACAGTYVLPENPWSTPVGYAPFSPQIQTLMQPCVDHAKDAFPDAVHRFKIGLAPGASLAVISRGTEPGDTGQIYVAVDSISGTQINGRIANSNVRAGGRAYGLGDTYSLPTSSIVDWQIEHLNRPEEGNWHAKYSLLRRDGLIDGDCDPQHREFQQFRLFRDNYSFVPPSGSMWKLRGKHVVGDIAPDMSMQEQGAGPYELNTLSSMRFHETPFYETESELVAAIHDMERRNFVDDERYTNLEHEVTAYAALEAKCSLSRRVLEDRRALLSRSGDRGPMIREIMELGCIHPSRSDVYVQLTYSHRHQHERGDPDFVDKANRVFESLAFSNGGTAASTASGNR